MTDRPMSDHQPQPAAGLSTIDRLRIGWVGLRYSLWLDRHFVRSRVRRELRRELVANLREAATDIGVSGALANVGSLRTLAAEVAQPDEGQARWYAGLVAALSVAAGLFVLFLIQAATYAEGVLDAEVDREVSSALFPFPWSEISVASGESGMSVDAQSGPLPMIVAVIVGLVVARPWRVLIGRRSGDQTDGDATVARLD